jgi:hypothetical protein
MFSSDSSSLLFLSLFLRNITIVYFNKGRGMDIVHTASTFYKRYIQRPLGFS